MPLAPVWKKSWKKAATKHEGYAALCPLIAASLSGLVPSGSRFSDCRLFYPPADNFLYIA